MITQLNWAGLKNLPNSPSGIGIDETLYQELVLIYSCLREIEDQVKLQQDVINQLITATGN